VPVADADDEDVSSEAGVEGERARWSPDGEAASR
jgi:hypothetical protein